MIGGLLADPDRWATNDLEPRWGRPGYASACLKAYDRPLSMAADERVPVTQDGNDLRPRMNGGEAPAALLARPDRMRLAGRLWNGDQGDQ